MNTTCCTEASEIDVYIAFPRSAVSIQTFPTAKLDANPYDATSDIVTWNLTQRAQVSLFYVDQNEQSRNEMCNSGEPLTWGRHIRSSRLAEGTLNKRDPVLGA